MNGTAFRVSLVGKFGVRLEPRFLQEVVRDPDFRMDLALHLAAGFIHLAVVALLAGSAQRGQQVRGEALQSLGDTEQFHDGHLAGDYHRGLVQQVQLQPLPLGKVCSLQLRCGDVDFVRVLL